MPRASGACRSDKNDAGAVIPCCAQGPWGSGVERSNVVRRDHVSVLGPHQPGRYSASSLLARRSACSTAAAKSASTAFLLIFPRQKSPHRNSLKGGVALAKPPPRRSSPARLRNGSSL